MPTLHMLVRGTWVKIPHMETLEVASPNVAAWHYTGTNGLLGIVASKRLWASSPLTLNDASEIRYGAKVVETAWRETQEEGGYLTDSQLKHGAFLADKSTVLEASERVYFFCTSCQEDSLNQWQGYSKAQGYAIKFDVAAPMATVLDRSAYGVDRASLAGGGWHKVVYNERLQIEMASDLLSFLLDAAQGRSSGGASQPAPLSDAELIASLVTRFKHPAFEGEQEVRYVAALPRDYPEKFSCRSPWPHPICRTRQLTHPRAALHRSNRARSANHKADVRSSRG